MSGQIRGYYTDFDRKYTDEVGLSVTIFGALLSAGSFWGYFAGVLPLPPQGVATNGFVACFSYGYLSWASQGHLWKQKQVAESSFKVHPDYQAYPRLLEIVNSPISVSPLNNLRSRIEDQITVYSVLNSSGMRLDIVSVTEEGQKQQVGFYVSTNNSSDTKLADIKHRLISANSTQLEIEATARNASPTDFKQRYASQFSRKTKQAKENIESIKKLARGFLRLPVLMAKKLQNSEPIHEVNSSLLYFEIPGKGKIIVDTETDTIHVITPTSATAVPFGPPKGS